MKRVLLIAVLFLGVISLTQAQRGSGQRPSRSGEGQPHMDPAERVERQTQRLKESLNLTDEQTVKVREIYTGNEEKRRMEFEKARASGEQPDREKMHEQMMASMAAQDKEIMALLTPEQKARYEQLISEREERMRNRSGGPGF
ncbi:MAG: Spy/CpxP family protein refolding chaperone [Mangrovibacterium sp.]